VAIGATYARVEHSLPRVAVIDIDAHFGNGTAEIFEGDQQAFYASIHLRLEDDEAFFPSCDSTRLGGNCSETNLVLVNVRPEDDAEGDDNTHSLSPLFFDSPGERHQAVTETTGKAVGEATVASSDASSAKASESPQAADPKSSSSSSSSSSSRMRASSSSSLARGRRGVRRAFREKVLPALYHFKPDIIFISAGFDGAASDPIGGRLGMRPEDFYWISRQLTAAADALCGGRVVSVLEGGYDLDDSTDGLARCAEAHVRGLSGSRLSSKLI
jgi:acetoin utilization deacetylase AcuC-like enzyme